MTQMEEKPLISVIVPVYNVKDYLEECLESIIKQSYTNLEIILVDDGSADGSAEICDRYAQTDNRMKVIHQENQGVARARKNGVLCSTGMYTGFVDADDKINSNMFEFMFENIGKCDVITVGCYGETVAGVKFEQTDSFAEGIYASEEDLDFFHANMLAYQNRYEYGALPYLWNKLFRTELLKEVMSNIDSVLSFAEDGEVVFQYLLKCEKICVTHKCLYYYRRREDSFMRSVDENYMHNLYKIYLALKSAFEKHPKKETLMRQLQLFVTQRIYWITGRMGFPAETRTTCYAFPYSDLDRNDRIVLYGAGKIGMAYYRQIFFHKLANMVLWVDKNWESYSDSYMPLFSPDSIKDCEYDYLIIAVKKKELADEIRQELIQQGVEDAKILWRVPAIY